MLYSFHHIYTDINLNQVFRFDLKVICLIQIVLLGGKQIKGRNIYEDNGRCH